MLVVDLFCGCGGFSTGAKLAGHKVILAIDSWDQALYAHEYNNPDTVHIQYELGGDLKACKELIMKHIPPGQKWHLHGSPPCQKLSVANHTTGNNKEGMRLVNWYLSLVELCNPSRWSMEQVVGATKFLNASDFERFHIINTADYKVPQTRKRLFIGAGWDIPQPLGQVGLADKLPHLRSEGNLIKGNKNTASVYSNGVHLGNRKLGALEDFKSIEEPTYTLCAGGTPRLFYYNESTMDKPEFVRALTVEECLTIQGFPKSYKFPDDMSKTTIRKLIGNAVSPPIAYLIMLPPFLGKIRR